jgi:hypothetical protein
MMDWLNSSTLGALIPLVALSIPIVAIISGLVQSWHSESQRHETMRQLARAGQPIPPELLRTRRNRDPVETQSLRPRPPGRSAFRLGLVLSFLGLGTALALYLVVPDGMYWAWGLIPIFLGLAYLVIWQIEARTPAS